jgi:tRNA:m4X modification enzyme
MLCLALMSVSPDTIRPVAVMVERNGVRYKADKTMREFSMHHMRVRMDIRHCSVPKLAEHAVRETYKSSVVASLGAAAADALGESSNVDVLILAKHLCGVATDYALISAKNFFPEGVAPTVPSPGDSSGTRTSSGDVSCRGVGIATCCHHACSWDDYAGADWLSQCHGFTSAEFEVMKHWSGWAHTLRIGANASSDRLTSDRVSPDGGETTDAVSGGASSIGNAPTADGPSPDLDGDDEDDGGDEHAVIISSKIPRPEGLSYTEMSEIGKMVKRVIDQGRVEYLRSFGISAHQVKYCDPSLSPECFMIVSTPPVTKIEEI